MFDSILSANLTEIKQAVWFTEIPDETIKWIGHPSIITRIPQFILSVVVICIGAIAPVWTYQFAHGLELALIPLGAGLFIYEYLSIKSITIPGTNFQIGGRTYVITDQRIIKKTGIISRNTLVLRYANIEHTSKTQSILERIFDFGDVEIATAGTGFTEAYLDDVRDPKRVAELIDNMRSRTTTKEQGTLQESSSESHR